MSYNKIKRRPYAIIYKGEDITDMLRPAKIPTNKMPIKTLDMVDEAIGAAYNRAMSSGELF